MTCRIYAKMLSAVILWQIINNVYFLLYLAVFSVREKIIETKRAVHIFEVAKTADS